MGGINTTNNNSNNTYNFYFNFNGGSVDANNALQTINQSPWFQQNNDSLSFGGNQFSGQIPNYGSISPPSMDLSAPPAGKGLITNESGWPANTTTTAGGYHIVANGNTAVSIYSPGQKVGEKAYAEWDGDPHFHGAGNVNFDFTGGKGIDGQTGQDFVLGDGTRIFAQTSADHGHPVTTGLTIQNGADRVDVTGVNGQPTTGQIQQDGYEWRALHTAAGAEGDRSTFYLRGDQNRVDVIQQSHGRIDGEVVGSKDVNGTYQTVVDQNVRWAGLGAGMRPPIGSRAWGNQLRDEIDDAQANAGARFDNWVGRPGYGLQNAVQNSYGIHANAIQGQFNSDLQQLFGGWNNYFPNYNSPWQALGALRDLLLSDNQWQRQLQYGQYVNFA